MGLAANLGAQLPLLVRGLYYDRWEASEQPLKWRTMDEFLALVSADLQHIRPVDPQDAARSVFKVLNRHVTAGQVEKIREALPEEVRRAWPRVGDAGGQRSAA